MKAWALYIAWLVGWFTVVWSFVFVPLSNLFRDGGGGYGAIRGLILISGWVVLFYGFYFIHVRLRAKAEEGATAYSGALTGAVQSTQESAALAEAHVTGLSAHPTAKSKVTPNECQPTPDAVIGQSRHAAGASHTNSTHDVPTSVMKSAGNPLVRRAFAQAMKEVESKTYDTGLWAMALV